MENKAKIKLLYLVNVSMPNPRANGIQIANTCSALSGNGIDLTLITRFSNEYDTPIGEYYGIQQTFKHVRIPSLDIPGIPFRYFIRNVTFLFFAQVYVIIRMIGSLFIREQLALYVRGETVLALIPISFCIPVFFETHQIRNYKYWYLIALKRCRGVVVITERLKQRFVEEFRIKSEKIIVARDAVDQGKFSPTLRDLSIWMKHRIPSSKKIILYSGTLALEKGVDVLAKSGSLLPPDVQIVFLGGTEVQVHSFKKRYGHIQNVSILGRVDYTEVPPYIASADVLVLPDSSVHTYSNLYTSPMKLFEYMASGRPILASRVPSLLEVLDDSTATFFESENATSLASALLAMLHNMDASEKKGKRAQEVVSGYTWQKRGEAIAKHIRYLLGT